MEAYYWTTDYPHYDNAQTMREYLENINTLDITMVDGSYAEGVNVGGEKLGIHASGDGDMFNHKIEFEKIKD